jgi:TetR/AcrR family transcriptional repressor of lmrAB and yxaGH operons
VPAAPKHRDAIIQAAVTLFRRNGYSATGVNDIVALSGAPKGSLYHYFPAGKTSIAEAAIGLAGRNAVETLTRLSAETSSAGALVRGFARLLAGWMAQSGFRDGSPFTTILLELAPDDAGVTEAGKAAFAARRDAVAAKLISDGVAPPRAAALAALALAALEGSLLQARVEQSVDAIESVARELEAALDAAVRAAAISEA